MIVPSTRRARSVASPEGRAAAVHMKPPGHETQDPDRANGRARATLARHHRWHGPVLAAAAAAAYIALMVSAAAGLADHDVFVMARVARDVLDGKALYTQAWDNKAPLAILFYALPAAIGPGSYVAIQLWLGVWLVGQALVLWFGLGRESGRSRWIAVALLLLLPLQRAEWCWASSEHAGNFFVVVLLVVAWRVVNRRARAAELVVAGAALAVLFNVRQNQSLFGIFPVMALVVTCARWRDRLKPLAAFAGGFLLSWLLVLLVVFVAGDGDVRGYVHTVFLAPAAYRGGWGEVSWLLMPLRQDFTVWLIFIVALVSLTGAHRWRSAALGITTLAVMLLPMRGYPHYWVQAFPAVALLGAAAADALGIAGTRRASAQGAIVAGLLSVSGVLTVSDLAWSGERARLDEVAEQIRLVLGRGEAGGTLFAAGHQSAYLYFSTGAATVHPIYWQAWMSRSLQGVLPVPIDEVVRSHQERPPAVIAVDEVTAQRILHAPAPDEEVHIPLLRSLLAPGRYREVSRVGDWHILRR